MHPDEPGPRQRFESEMARVPERDRAEVVRPPELEEPVLEARAHGETVPGLAFADAV
jgi:hypothetical protein